jgi:radical SAM protein with 4Fe4S-binding SPASM domain
MTITPYNINRLKEVVDEYISIGLDSIFLRPINPFGRATNPEFFNAYTTEDFLNQYKAILEYIIEVNKYRHFPEIYTTILLTKIITPFSTGFVDLQSPAGVGISGVIYDVSGDVFVSDEARMMNYVYGEKKFCIGNVNMGSFKSIFCNDKLKKIISESCSESLAPCAWCAYLPYCGLDPVRNFIKYDTISPYMGKTEDCIRHKEMFKHLITLIESGDNDKINILWSWITSRSVKEIAPSINIEEYL